MSVNILKIYLSSEDLGKTVLGNPVTHQQQWLHMRVVDRTVLELDRKCMSLHVWSVG